MAADKIINRPLYINKIEPHIGKHIIKVLVGLRRSGKSYLMLGIIDRIKQLYPDANIIYINKEHYEFDHIRNYHDLQAHFDKLHKAGSSNYFFVDEIQEIDNFEKCIKRHDKPLLMLLVIFTILWTTQQQHPNTESDIARPGRTKGSIPLPTSILALSLANGARTKTSRIETVSLSS